ncbi:hypothetical protein PAPYR_13425 [Paratrimastix pyriformis]|uniref:Uncharacterized protein n=1 Tax=Paratrimastix pyriformis TaxID=342808 RepID=A0ABQ8U3T2_9EUKA|nr:hypothetical protein PAPYR_13425 [Paratrimastix pyriformis]
MAPFMQSLVWYTSYTKPVISDLRSAIARSIQKKLMRIVFAFLCLLALSLGSPLDAGTPEVSAYWSPANGAFFFQSTSGQPNPHLVTIDTLVGLTDASCTAVVGRLSLTFSDVQSAERFAASIMPGIPLTSQKYSCADGSVPNVIYSGEIVVEKESVSFATVRANLNNPLNLALPSLFPRRFFYTAFFLSPRIHPTSPVSLPPRHISLTQRFSCRHESIQPRSSQMLPPSLFPPSLHSVFPVTTNPSNLARLSSPDISFP